MEHVQHPSKLSSDVKEGDLVRLHLHGTDSFFTGYVWHKSREDFENTHSNFPNDGYTIPIYGLNDCDLFLNALTPYGNDMENDDDESETGLECAVQMVGINTSKAVFANRIAIKGYDIIERCNHDRF